MKNNLLVLPLLLVMSSNVIATVSDVEGIEDDQLRQITQQFETDTNNIAKQIQSESDSIKPPEPDNPVEAFVQIDLDVSWDKTSFKMDIPKVTMKNKKMSLHLPQVTMKNKSIKFDYPKVFMETKVVGKKPEVTVKWVVEKVGFFKTKVPKTYVKWTDIKMDVPVTKSARKEIITGIPQFKMDKTSFTMGIPQIRMETKKFSLHLPQFKVTNIKAGVKESEKKAAEIEKKAKLLINSRTAKFNSDMKGAVIAKISKPFDQQKKTLLDQVESLERQRASANTLFEESLKTLSLQKMQVSDAQYIAIKKQQRESNSSFLTAIETVRSNIKILTDQQKKVVEDAMNNLVG